MTLDDGAARRLPMFPLSTVLFPGEFIPLQVFEPRYLELTNDCLAGDGNFGVVLILRGAEVGGGDVRSAVGTVAHIESAAPFIDGRYGLLARGTERIRVTSWMEDAPYPLAWVEPAVSTGSVSNDSFLETERAIRRVRALYSELGGGPALGADLELAPDPEEASWQLAALAPFSPFDRQRLIDTDEVPFRFELMARLALEQAGDLERLLASGGN